MTSPEPPAWPPSNGRRITQALARAGCSPAEALALGLLAVGAVTALGLLWFTSRPSAVAAPPAPLAVASPAVLPSEGAAVAPSPPSEIVVHLTGQVDQPGVYRLPGGSRLADALPLAGGPLPGAALESLNLARVLADGEHVHVPAPGEAPLPAAPAAGAGATLGTAPSDALVDLNLATLAELDALPGVGPVLAQRILDHRAAIGGFRDVGQLREITGIGERIFQNVAPRVSV